MPIGIRGTSDFDASLFERYTVKSGDNLEKIARRLGVDANEIRRPDGSRVHEADRDLIFARETLYVPKTQGRAPTNLDAVAPPRTTATRPTTTSTANRTTKPASLRVTFGIRPGEGTPPSLGLGHDLLRQLVKGNESEEGKVAVQELFAAVLPKGAAKGHLHVRLATLARFADAATRAGYPLTSAGIGRLQADAGITDEQGPGPRTAQALADRIRTPSDPAPAARLGDWVELQLPADRPPAEIVSKTRKDVPAWDKRSREILGAGSIDIVDSTKYDALITEAAALNGLDPALVKAVMCRESGFKRTAASGAGGKGLMQLLDGTALANGLSGNIYDARENVLAGCRYLRALADRFNGDVVKMLAGYNAGPNAVSRALKSYGETRNYVQDVLIFYDHYKATGQPPAP